MACFRVGRGLALGLAPPPRSAAGSGRFTPSGNRERHGRGLLLCVPSREAASYRVMLAHVRIGVSACLLGQKVRHDGDHRRSEFVADLLANQVECTPVCPEVEVGMGVPRPRVELVRSGTCLRLVESERRIDHTRSMQSWARRRSLELRQLGLSGYVFKRGSPSCGVWNVPVHQKVGRVRKQGRGMFAARLMETLPLLPVEQEDRLEDERLRAAFVERVFAYARLRQLFRGRWSRGSVAVFHAAHAHQLAVHSQRGALELAQLVGRFDRMSRTRFRSEYEKRVMQLLERPIRRTQDTAAMRRITRRLGEIRSEGEVRVLRRAVEAYAAGDTPRREAMTVLRRLARDVAHQEFLDSTYVFPDPRELALG